VVDNWDMDITAHASVEEFFHEVVTDALAAVRVEAAAPVEWYLVALLGDFARARLPDEPLVLKLAGAAAAPPAERVRQLKEVGDTSLYVSGFFTESLGRTLVDADYYIGLGSRAYAELAGRMHGPGGSLAEVYRELAARFPAFVDVLAEVRRRCDFVGDDLVRLYEQWTRTRDAWIERKLRALGVLVDPSGTVQ
jgi:hypothetical protein